MIFFTGRIITVNVDVDWILELYWNYPLYSNRLSELRSAMNYQKVYSLRSLLFTNSSNKKFVRSRREHRTEQQLRLCCWSQLGRCCCIKVTTEGKLGVKQDSVY